MTMKIAKKSGNALIAAPRSVAQGAHFDLTVVSARGFDEAPDCSADPVSLLVGGLEAKNKCAALLDCRHFDEPVLARTGQNGCSAPNALLHKVIAPRTVSPVDENDESRFNRHPDKIFYAAGRLLCLHDRLFDLEGGTEFVRCAVSAARSAGRETVLLCTGISTAFFKRQEIIASFGGFLDCVVGEPPAVLCLSGLNRIDSLVPRYIHLGTGLVLYRVDYDPIVIRPGCKVVEPCGGRISREAFWSEFVPSALEGFLARGLTTGEPAVFHAS